MRVLVTGGTGNLGLPLVRALLDSTDHEIRLFGRSEPPLPAHERLSWAAGDLRERADLMACTEGIDAVCHLGGLTHSNRPSAYEAVNVTGTRNLLAAAKQHGVPFLIHVSTWIASPGGGAYARTKLRAEELVQRSGTGWIILRPADVYGPGQAGALSTLLDRVRARRRVPIAGHGRHLVSPLYVGDFVAALLAALHRPRLAGRRYTLTGPETITLLQVVDRAAAHYRVRRRTVRVPLPLIALVALAAAALGRNRPALDQIARLLVERDDDCGPARRDLGFAPRPLEEGLAALRGD
jgi:NADH dehydrogenase